MRLGYGELSPEEIDKCHATARHMLSKPPFTLEEMRGRVAELSMHCNSKPRIPKDEKGVAKYTESEWTAYVEGTWRPKAVEVWAMARMQLESMGGI